MTFFNKKIYLLYFAILLILIFLFWFFCKKSEILSDIDKYSDDKKNAHYQLTHKLPIWITSKIINIEDKRFFSNELWLDFKRILVSIYNNLSSSKLEWWSTIDQQLIKILYKNYNNRSIFAKICEIFLALKLNIYYDKNQILYSYINHLPMTNNIIWLKSACDIYLSKDCDYLSESEQYFIISIYQLGINPYNANNFNKIKNRSKFLCDNFWGSWCQNIYIQSPISYTELNKYMSNINPSISNYLKSDNDWYKKDQYRDQKLYDNIQTSINILKPHLNNNQVYDCCVIVLDSKWNLKSMNICRDINDDSPWADINICLTKRQTWSSIKPFLYMLGMQKLRLNANSKITDEPITYFLENSNEYQPKNFDLKYHWEITIAEALWNSLNIPAVKILHEVWLIDFQNWILKLRNAYHPVWQNIDNIYSDHQKQLDNDLWLSMALWTYTFSPLEFTNLWRVFLDKKENYMSMITQSYQDQNIDKISEIYQILSDNSNRYISFGVDNRLNLQWRAVKSGTSRNFVDWRTCGTNKKIDRVVCIWVWNHDNRSASASSSQTASLLRNLVAKWIQSAN